MKKLLLFFIIILGCKVKNVSTDRFYTPDQLEWVKQNIRYCIDNGYAYDIREDIFDSPYVRCKVDMKNIKMEAEE